MLGDLIERAARQLVWRTPLQKTAALAGLYEIAGDFTQPAGIEFHGLGLTRNKTGFLVEAYCGGMIDRPLIRRGVSALMAIPQSAIVVVPAADLVTHIGAGDGGGHHELVTNGGYGTVGGLCQDLLGPWTLAVSNNHVFAQSNQAQVGDALLYASGQPFGALHRFHALAPQPALNDLDGAVGTVHGTEVPAGPRIQGHRPPQLGLRVHKYGAKSGHTTGTILGTTAAVALSYPSLGTINFRRTVRIVGDHGPFSEPGDSGSLVLDANNAVVGIVFGGELNGAFSLANPADALASCLSIAFPG